MNIFRWIAGTMAVLNGLLGLVAGFYLLFPISALFQFRNWQEVFGSLGCILMAIPGYVIWWTYFQAARNRPTRPALWMASVIYNGIGIALGVWASFKGMPYPFFVWPSAMAVPSLWAWLLLRTGKMP